MYLVSFLVVKTCPTHELTMNIQTSTENSRRKDISKMKRQEKRKIKNRTQLHKQANKIFDIFQTKLTNTFQLCTLNKHSNQKKRELIEM